MPRFFCHLSHSGQNFEDERGFDAGDAPEAVRIARAIAEMLLLHDPARGSDLLALYSESGTAIHSASIGDWTTGDR